MSPRGEMRGPSVVFHAVEVPCPDAKVAFEEIPSSVSLFFVAFLCPGYFCDAVAFPQVYIAFNIFYQHVV